MNFYTKNSSPGEFFFAAFSRGCLREVVSRWLQIFRGVETRALVKVFSVVCGVCLKFYFHTKPFFRSEVPAYVSELCSLVTAKYEFDWQSADWDMSYYLTGNDVELWSSFAVLVMRLEYFTVNDGSRRRVVSWKSVCSAAVRFCFCNSPNTTPSGRVGKHNSDKSLSSSVQCTRQEGKSMECGRTFRLTTLVVAEIFRYSGSFKSLFCVQ